MSSSTSSNAIGKPVGADELTKAKNYVALGFPERVRNDRAISPSHIEEMVVYKLPDDYFDRYVANIQAVTSAAVQKAAATYIQPQRFAVVVVGDRKVIEPGVRGAEARAGPGPERRARRSGS